MEKDRGLRIHDQKQSTKLKQKNATHREEEDDSSEEDQVFDEDVKNFGATNKVIQNANQKIKTKENGQRESVKTLLKKEKRKEQSQQGTEESQLRKEIIDCEEQLALISNMHKKDQDMKKQREILEKRLQDLIEDLD